MFALSDIERLVTFDRAGVGHLSRALTARFIMVGP
jgi:hypothetical protein